MGIVAQPWEIVLAGKSGNLGIIRRDGSASRFQIESETCADPGRFMTGFCDVGERLQEFLSPLLLNHRIGVVIVNRLEVLCLNAIPGDAALLLGRGGNVANEVFDENRIVVSLLGDVLFVGTLQKTVEFAAGAFFDEAHEIFDPDRFAGKAHRVSHNAPLIVGTVGTDRFRAGAEGGDRDEDGNNEIGVVAVSVDVENDFVVHHPDFFGDRGRLREKEGETQFDVGALGIEPLQHFRRKRGDGMDVEDRAVGVEHFDEAAHVGAFVFLGQIHGHGEGRDRALLGLFLVPDPDRVLEILHPDTINVEVPGIRLALYIG